MWGLNLDDEKIIDLFFERNERAITETDVKYRHICFSVSHNILQNKEDSEECLDDTYLCAWNKMPPVRPRNLCAFLCKIIRNFSLKKMEYKTAKKRKADEQISFEELEESIPDNTISDTIAIEELGILINSFLRTQKGINRKMFIRRYFYFESIESISTGFCVSQSNVKSVLYRMRVKLRAYLEKEGVVI